MSPDSPALCRTVFRALQSALALTDAEANAGLFRAYSDNPPSEPSPSQNVCYYHLQSDPQASVLPETNTANSVHEVSSFIPCRLILVFYGPDCEARAHRAASFLFLDGSGKPRRILRSADLFLIPDHTAPAVVYEETGKAYRKRADLVIRTRLLSNEVYASIQNPSVPIPIPIITDPPDISVLTSL